jgi:murein DD-endopeptidase MepM/ murein hydrolase activator NlpD
MQPKISFLMVNHQEAAMRRVTFTKRILKVATVSMAVFFLCGATSLYWFHHSYQQNLMGVQQSAVDLKHQIKKQKQQIEKQRSQLQNFAKEINLLKDELLALNAIEKKIRLYANMSSTDADDNRFGIGGHGNTETTAKINIDQNHERLIQEMNQLTAYLQETVDEQGEGFEELLKRLEEKVEILARTPSIQPVVGRLTSKFGYRKSPFDNRKEFHEGYDIGAPHGTPIVATADGVVSFVGRNNNLGKTIAIDHGYGYETVYGHTSKVFKECGQKVKKGDVIALVGNTGRSTGPHLHYEVKLNGKNLNPEDYIVD